MFCPNCGKELPEGVKFCAYCGKSILDKDQQGSDQTIMQDHTVTVQGSSDVVEGVPQKSAILPQKNSKNAKVFLGLAVALVLIIGVVFAVRSSNEQSMIREIPFAIYNDGGHDKVEAYYKEYFGDSMMLGCNVEDFSITKGTNSNSYNLAGKFEATDTSQDSCPTYNAYVTGTVTTNFFRTQWSVDWSLQYQTPEDKNIITLQTLFQAYHSNAALADNTYANQYLNVSGTITNIRNTYSNTVEVEFGIPTELFYAYFEFDPNDSALYNLQVGNQTTLTGFLEPGGSTYTLHFSNASLYQRNAANSPTTPAPNPVASAQPSNDYPDTEAGRILNQYAGSYMDDNGNYLFVGADESGNARALLHPNGTGLPEPISVILYDYSTNEYGWECVSGNDYGLGPGSMPTYAMDLGFYGTDPDSLTVDLTFVMSGETMQFGFFRTNPSNIPYTNPYY